MWMIEGPVGLYDPTLESLIGLGLLNPILVVSTFAGITAMAVIWR
jgi:hypothetical protein